MGLNLEPKQGFLSHKEATAQEVSATAEVGDEMLTMSKIGDLSVRKLGVPP